MDELAFVLGMCLDLIMVGKRAQQESGIPAGFFNVEGRDRAMCFLFARFTQFFLQYTEKIA